jgi:hypothetical protein
MACQHLKQLLSLCAEHKLLLSSSDVIRLICPTCGEEEECPSVLYDEYARRHPEADEGEPADRPRPTPPGA